MFITVGVNDPDMSREYPSAVAAFASRLRRRLHAEQGGPRLPNKSAVESSECGLETTPSVRAAAAAYDRMNRGGGDDRREDRD